ncbi:MAG: class I SAM-dependent methyltransferase, partial [Pseudomonadota bacterium]
MDSAEDAQNFETHELFLKFCDECGFIFNAAFDSAKVDYASATEESQHFSGTFNRFAKQLIAEIACLYDLEDKNILEIGCGKGDFIRELVLQTKSVGFGIDPGFLSARFRKVDERNIVFRREYFDAAKITIDPDFVVCRHTLEHIPDVGRFMSDIAKITAGRPNVGIFFETPDVFRVLRDGAFWDIYYEHCSYFTLQSHARLFARFGMDVAYQYLAYDDQYIIQYAKPRGGEKVVADERDLREVRDLAADFPRHVAEIR